MFIIKSSRANVVVPGFLLGYHGDAMMPEQKRYVATLPFFLVANGICVALSIRALISGHSHDAFAAFALFMAIFSARMLTQKLVRVNFAGSEVAAEAAPFKIRLNLMLVALSLIFMGGSFIHSKDQPSSPFFLALGLAMFLISIASVMALRRRRR